MRPSNKFDKRSSTTIGPFGRSKHNSKPQYLDDPCNEILSYEALHVRVALLLALAIIFASVLVLFIFSAVAHADVKCSRSNTVTINKSNFIYKNHKVIRDSNNNIIGYDLKPTLIFNVKIPGAFPTSFLADRRNRVIAKCVRLPADGHQGRFVCTTIRTDLTVRKLMKEVRSALVYFIVSSKQCVKVPHLGQCVNSVKGLCDRVIK